MGSSSRTPGSHFNKSSQVSNLISFGFNVFSVFLGTSGWTSFSVLLVSAAGLDSSPWLVPSGFASVSLSDLGFASADGVSAVTSLGFSSGLATLTASAVSVVAASLLVDEAVSDAVATPSAFSNLFSLACSPSCCLSASLVGCSLSPETSSVLAPLFSGTAVSDAKAGAANKTAPIISEQAPTDNLRIL